MRLLATLSLALAICVILSACVKTDDFEVPVVEDREIILEGNLTSIQAVKGNFNFESEEIVSFQDTDIWITGFVISDDSGGNFYKELIIQDKPKEPTAGIQIMLDHNAIFQTFNVGRKVFVKLDGLSLGYKNGTLQLGYRNRGDIVPIPRSMIDEHLIRTNVVEEITPLALKISDITSELKNLYVKIDGVQFDRNLVREGNVFSFASHPADRYDGIRQLESCDTGETLLLSTSTFSNFKSLLIPQGSGSVEGVLSRDYYDDQFVLMLNSPANLNMNGPRCDPEFLKCSDERYETTKVIFEENFEGVTSNTTLTSRNWTNINVNGGETKFKPTLSSGNRVLRISAYNTQESPLEAWLVSPPVNLDSYTNEMLKFDLRSSFDKGLLLKVYVTTDFSGNPGSTEWVELDAAVPLGPSNSNSTIFKETKLDISCLDGKIWIGFRYLGSAPDKTTTYDLDNIRITGN